MYLEKLITEHSTDDTKLYDQKHSGYTLWCESPNQNVHYRQRQKKA